MLAEVAQGFELLDVVFRVPEHEDGADREACDEYFPHVVRLASKQHAGWAWQTVVVATMVRLRRSGS